ncbi:sensor histidine kinase [Nonomuraea sp. NEAU-A123]|uniref:sensor histidine kinase n=1 Tax=Nonomuraea sp. NEAU-A123 TaxID=2839649 RepID=UPI001BE416E8|nr:sensor histidine kinase [Nonomuraea sp. NEAU-A123]MBT2224828.1 sensor histidine kinase [Nonomuraea sp. NEAU-A123]
MRKKPGNDVYVALIVAVVQVVLSQGAAWGQRDFREPLDSLAYVLLLLGPVAILGRRKFPVSSTVVTLLATYVYVVGGYPYGPIFLAPGFMLWSLVLGGRRLIAWIFSGVTLAVFLIYASLQEGRNSWVFHTLAITAFILLFMVIAELFRIRSERRAEHQRVVEEESRRQASEERLTMAQELHDVLAHNISLIHVQASTALHLMDDQPEQARTALTTIKSASKEVLGEMRSVLNVLREGAPRSPTAGLDRLDELVTRSGLDVTLKHVGSRPLPPQLERAAYRIIQEALTNAARHAPGSRVTVRLEYGTSELGVLIADTGATKPAVLAEAGSGNGIPGMRERASALGGTLTAGPAGNGFQVEAKLPFPEETS